MILDSAQIQDFVHEESIRSFTLDVSNVAYNSSSLNKFLARMRVSHLLPASWQLCVLP